jgi:hypothetical protein
MPSKSQKWSAARIVWKIQHRLYRIAARESSKATYDALIYGVGFVEVDPVRLRDGMRHIPSEEVICHS